ncbi:MAG: hypothetical protein ACRDNI_03795 [Gaiellaceae bacterium]
MSVAARTADRVQARRAAFARVRLGTAPALAVLVTASFGLRAVLAWLRDTPTFFADEYIYAELARSLAESGQPLIRGAWASFPALLQPIVTAPAWLVDDVEVSFRIVQTLGALLMSLAAIPVYLLARRVGLTARTGFALAALTLLVPDLIYSGFVVSEPVALPLALTAVLAGLVALVRPGARAQLVFLAFAVLATLARTQFVVLPLCFLAATVVMGLRERRLRAALREQALVLALVVLPALGLLALGPASALGFYESALDKELASFALAKWAGADLMLLAYASGVVLAPGALLGLWLAVRRPRSREELAFGALAIPVVAALVVEAAAWGIEGSRIQERYFFYVVPLVGIAFALYASRGWPHRLAHAALAAGLVAVAARVPLSGFSAADGKTNSPTLFATARLEQLLGDVGLASLALALGVALLLGAVVAASRRPSVATPVALGLALAVTGVASAAAVSLSLATADRTAGNVLPADPSFVDRSGVRDTAMLQTGSSERGFAAAYLFWNRSVDDVYFLPDASPPDSFAATRLEIAPDGTLLAGGEPVTRPLLADGYSDTLRFRAAEEVARGPIYRLLRSDAPQRLALYMRGRYADGWLGLSGTARLWPDDPAGLRGIVSFRLTAPSGASPVAVRLEPRGGAAEEIVVAPGAPHDVSFPACSPGPWVMDFSAPSSGSVGDRFVSVRASEPTYRPDPAACR